VGGVYTVVGVEDDVVTVEATNGWMTDSHAGGVGRLRGAEVPHAGVIPHTTVQQLWSNLDLFGIRCRTPEMGYNPFTN
jgi:hypothetical protein